MSDMVKFDLLKFDLEVLRSPVWYGLPYEKYYAEDVIPISRDEIFYVEMQHETFIYNSCEWSLRVRTPDDLLYIYLKESDREKIISELDSLFSGMVRFVRIYTYWTLPVYMNAERITAVKYEGTFYDEMKIWFDKKIDDNSYDLVIHNGSQSVTILNQLQDLHFNKYI